MAEHHDYYEVIGVDRNATADEIRKAYRRLARKYHPDVNKSKDAATRFAEMQEAYEVLADAEKRKAYDRFGHAGVGVGQGPAGAGPGAGWNVHFGGDAMDSTEFASVFDQFFGGAAGGPPGRGAGGPFPGGRAAAPRKGEDTHHPLQLTFMTAANGGTEQLRLPSSPRADETKFQTISLKIPPGIDTGAQLRVRGKGMAGHNGGDPGDIILDVQVGGHPYFRREGLDLYVDVPITITEATFGTKVTVPLLNGSVEIKVPAGASSGQKLRVKDKGLTDGKGRHGDYYAVVQLVADKNVSERARQLLAELDGELKNPRESAPWAADLRSD